jgi:HEAT repeat protein
MALSDSSQTNMTTSPDTIPPTQPSEDVAPPVGITPPEVLARDAAAGRRGSAWRLLYWIIENDPRAVVAFASLDDDRLARHLLEFIAMGSTWAGKPFVVPVPLRSAYARTRLRTLFLPGSGIDSMRAERVLLSAIHDSRPAIRENAASILGILGSRTATPALIEALQDPVPAVRLQAAKALGRVRDAAAIPALLAALQNADEQLGSQIFSSLVRLGHVAVPVLIERSTAGSAWMRWNCVRALADIRDLRALPVLVRALGDTDHSIAWMGAKGLVQFGRQGVGPVLRLLMAGEVTPWLVETASYVLRNQQDPKLKPYLEPVLESMRGVAFRVSTPQVAQKALSQLIADGVIQP